MVSLSDPPGCIPHPDDVTMPNSPEDFAMAAGSSTIRPLRRDSRPTLMDGPETNGAFFSDSSTRPSTIWTMSGDVSPYSAADEEFGNPDSLAVVAGPTAVSTAVPPTRHPEFWLYDGSIVFSVENTLFRVHQTILAKHSEVFADLFTVPQPDGEDTVDGCHLVHLQDSEKDFEDLLRAVYIPEYFDSCSPDYDLEHILSFTSGILRLSTKYMIRYLRQRCISLLLNKLPHTYAGYEAKSTSSNPDRYRSDTIMRAIKLARENNVPEIIPYAYYCLSRFPHKRFLKDRPDDISWKDKMIVLIGRERLQWAQMSLSHQFLLLFRRSPTCQSSLCAHARSPHAEWHELEKHGSAHPLRAYEGWDNLNVCSDCITYCQARHLEGRKEVWQLLPTWFELPTWEELKATQNR
ncbi:hypothetical protein GALMADRAFT_254142 [Galerina marginata CBS 339.88]|uniref:BTB domain-containing protein n=1 Tax=Galerina marginata (strain CBS 339.88) TaxID=685588 RepID=A0A067SK96_GALM3|nr:hypothetical protein GALMADRAFT_254142 [Galerina marginata CBS 339.88]